MNFRLISWNINGIRSAEQKGFWTLMHQLQPNVVCLQEIRGHLQNTNLIQNQLPHFVGGLSLKNGLHGVGILSITQGKQLIWNAPHLQTTGRCIGIDLHGIHIWSIYAPTLNHQSKEHCTLFWEALLEKMGQWVSRPTILCGDLNLIATENDIHSSLIEHHKKMLPMQQAIFEQIFQQGWVDAWRLCHPHTEGFSFWSRTSPRVRPENRGLRLDYVLCSPHLKSSIHKASMGASSLLISDHAPVIVDFILTEHLSKNEDFILQKNLLSSPSKTG